MFTSWWMKLFGLWWFRGIILVCVWFVYLTHSLFVRVRQQFPFSNVPVMYSPHLWGASALNGSAILCPTANGGMGVWQTVKRLWETHVPLRHVHKLPYVHQGSYKNKINIKREVCGFVCPCFFQFASIIRHKRTKRKVLTVSHNHNIQVCIHLHPLLHSGYHFDTYVAENKIVKHMRPYT